MYQCAGRFAEPPPRTVTDTAMLEMLVDGSSNTTAGNWAFWEWNVRKPAAAVLGITKVAESPSMAPRTCEPSDVRIRKYGSEPDGDGMSA